MPRKDPTRPTLKALFAKSQNQCAFPGCTAPLIDADDLFVGQVAHIHAASPGGARFDATQTDEDRRKASNLLLICYPHHVSIDQFPERYTAVELKEIKRRHEQNATYDCAVPDTVINLLALRLKSFWARLENIAQRRAERLELSVGVDTDLKPQHLARLAIDLVTELENSTNRDLSINEIGDGVIYYHNTFQKLRIILRQLEITTLHSIVVMGDTYDGIDGDIDRREKELKRLIENEVICD